MPNDLTTAELKDWLRRSRNGDPGAEHRIAEALYPSLKSIAQRCLRPLAHRLSLRATDLTHEAYLRLVDQRTDWHGRAHFLGIAARVTRRVLIELIRERQAEKRGAGIDFVRLELEPDPGTDIAQESRIDWLQLEQALQQLEGRDPIAGRVVELRYFGGLNNDEVADVLDIGVATVVRHWKFARAWLHRRL
ncbi:MAG: sigma-70 family RNA polymerase sigma factor [Rhodanobacteraceae bacterium]|nr:sigma-70 family RNA polymerase sigma factor [Rhodanobacteraceae bacterium]